jgi:PAS domain S-box-containing protein
MLDPDLRPPELERLGLVLETALDAVVVMRSDGTVADWNRVAETTFGWSRDEAVGRFMVDLIVPPQHRDSHIRGLDRFNATGEERVLGQRLEISALRRNGEEFPVELSITFTRTADQLFFVGFLRDISSRRRSERLLARQVREAELLFRIAQFAAESDSVEDVLARTLEAICDLADWPIGHGFLCRPGDDELAATDIWHNNGDPGFEKLRQATLATRFTRDTGLPGRIWRSGEPAWVLDTEREPGFLRKGLGYSSAFGFPIKSSGRTMAVLEFFTHEHTPPDEDLLLTVQTLGEQVGRVLERNRSIVELRELNESLEERVQERTSELLNAQEQLRQAQKMEAIGQLTGGVAHDFNNLLTIIRSSVDLLRRPEVTEERRIRYLEAIADTSDRAARLTAQLLAFARRQALKPEVFDVTGRIESIADMLRTVLGPRVKLDIRSRCPDCFVEADAIQFETALVNIAVNARDAMDGEGELNVSIDRLEASGGKAFGGKAFVGVSVSDSGHGIPADRIDRIFEPFYTTKEVGRGTGLGLSQVYGFAKQSGGEISVASEPGRGARFTLCLPAAEPPSQVAQPQPAKAVATPATGRVLIVEDNEKVGESARQLLADLGFEPTLCADAGSALALLETGAGFDLIFSDVVMPGMGGVEFGRIVRARWPHLPVVLTTGYSPVLVEEGRDGFPLLQKPYSVEALASLLSEARATAASG